MQKLELLQQDANRTMYILNEARTKNFKAAIKTLLDEVTNYLGFETLERVRLEIAALEHVSKTLPIA